MVVKLIVDGSVYKTGERLLCTNCWKCRIEDLI